MKNGFNFELTITKAARQMSHIKCQLAACVNYKRCLTINTSICEASKQKKATNRDPNKQKSLCLNFRRIGQKRCKVHFAVKKSGELT